MSYIPISQERGRIDLVLQLLSFDEVQSCTPQRASSNRSDTHRACSSRSAVRSRTVGGFARVARTSGVLLAIATVALPLAVDLFTLTLA